MQQGQAIVLIAIMLAVVVGMAALAIDGSRAYALRRDLQAAVDGAALAAGDRLQQGGTYQQAEMAAATSFATNLRLYAPSPLPCSGYGTPGPSPVTVTCTWPPPDGTILTQVVFALGPQGSLFTLSASRALQLQFARILTNGVTPRLIASAFGGVNNQLYAPTVAALDQAGCGGAPGSAITVAGGGTLDIQGDLVSSGAITVSSGNLSVAGDIYARCQSSLPGSVTTNCYPGDTVPPCTPPNVAGAVRSGYHFTDPNYPPPTVVGAGQGMPGAGVVLSPGLYSGDPNFSTNVCYFLAGGVYEWQLGYTNAGGFVGNELKPPDEPNATNNTALGHQMWDTGGVNCAGAFNVTAISGSSSGITHGSWNVEVTSTRNDSYAGTMYRRESAPSMCRAVDIDFGQVVQVQISNVPGAAAYNVYMAPPAAGCGGQFGLVGSIPVPPGTVFNDNTTRCPEYTSESGHCSLNFVTGVFDSTVLAGFAPISGPLPPVIGAYPPTGETPPLRVNLPNQNPDRAAPNGGDRANENQCDTSGGTATSCPGAITPGAVTFYIPSGGCLNATTGGDNFVFSGYQYDWVLVYEPGAAYPPANSCSSNVLGSAADSAWVGLIYMPTAWLTVKKAATFRTEATGGLMAARITFTSNMPTIIFNPSYAPIPPAARLVS